MNITKNFVIFYNFGGYMKRCVFLLLFLCAGWSVVVYGQSPSTSHPKNIILMIGDGMGLSQITAGMYENGNSLHLERIKHIGLIKTHSMDQLITDSAAGATAFAGGKKTNNGAISVDTSGTPIPSILEMAHQSNMSTGVIATSIIQHATPACFYAHQPSRAMYEQITEDFLKGSVDIAIGGGRRLFTQRKDDRDILAELEAKGYTHFKSLDKAKNSSATRMMVIVSKGHLTTIKKGRGDYLAEASMLAIERLDKNSNGYFLLVEGSQIDWGGHENNSDYIIDEMIDFDATVGKVLDYAEQDGETLVVITADHETGGYSITGGSLAEEHIEARFSTDNHTATLIPVFAYGPGSEEFTGIYDNTDIFYKMVQAYGNHLRSNP